MYQPSLSRVNAVKVPSPSRVTLRNTPSRRNVIASSSSSPGGLPM
jgi:hypothetical protein